MEKMKEMAHVLNGLQYGFKLGFHQSRSKLNSAQKNKLSAFQHPSVIDDFLANEVALGRVVGPFPAPSLHNLTLSSAS